MYSRSLNVFIIARYVKKIMIQQGMSNNPKRFVIRDPCGGNWGRVQNKEIMITTLKRLHHSVVILRCCNECKVFKNLILEFYFETLLGPNIKGNIGVMKTLIIMRYPTLQTTSSYMVCDIF